MVKEQLITDVIFVRVVKRVDHCRFRRPLVLVNGFPESLDVLISVEFQYVEHVQNKLVFGDV